VTDDPFSFFCGVPDCPLRKLGLGWNTCRCGATVINGGAAVEVEDQADGQVHPFTD